MNKVKIGYSLENYSDPVFISSRNDDKMAGFTSLQHKLYINWKRLI